MLRENLFLLYFSLASRAFGALGQDVLKVCGYFFSFFLAGPHVQGLELESLSFPARAFGVLRRNHFFRLPARLGS